MGVSVFPFGVLRTKDAAICLSCQGATANQKNYFDFHSLVIVVDGFDLIISKLHLGGEDFPLPHRGKIFLNIHFHNITMLTRLRVI